MSWINVGLFYGVVVIGTTSLIVFGFADPSKQYVKMGTDVLISIQVIIIILVSVIYCNTLYKNRLWKRILKGLYDGTVSQAIIVFVIILFSIALLNSSISCDVPCPQIHSLMNVGLIICGAAISALLAIDIKQHEDEKKDMKQSDQQDNIDLASVSKRFSNRSYAQTTNI